MRTKRSFTLGSVLVSTAVLCLPSPGRAEDFKLIKTIENPFPGPPGDFGGEFGRSLALSGSVLLIGAPDQETSAGVRAGAAYVFRADRGNLLHILEDPTPGSSEHYGFATSLSGSVAVVGSPLDDAVPLNGGAAYVFDASSGDLSLELLGESARAEFGTDVAVEGDRILVGSPDADGGARTNGIAGLFDRVTGARTQLFLDPTPSDFESFGASVAMSGGKVVIGNPSASASATGDGVVYLFDAQTGNLDQTFVNPSPTDFDYFGSAVAMDGTRVLVAAPREDIGDDTDASAVYLFDAESGALRHTFLDPAQTAFNPFGGSIDIDGTTVAIGDSGGLDSSTRGVFIFDAVTGELTQTIVPPEPVSSSIGFGIPIDLDGDLLAVGAPRAVVNENNASGIVYVFSRGTCPTSTALTNHADRAHIQRTLYRLRDEVMSRSGVGRYFTRLFYRHAAEIRSLMEGDPELKTRTGNALASLAPKIAAVADDGAPRLSRGELREIESLMEAYAAQGSLGLRVTLWWLRRGMLYRNYLDYFGFGVDDSGTAGS